MGLDHLRQTENSTTSAGSECWTAERFELSNTVIDAPCLHTETECDDTTSAGVLLDMNEMAIWSESVPCTDNKVKELLERDLAS